MLHISLSTQRNRHLDQLFDTVCKNALQLNERQMIIVPEQFSHSLERSLCKVGGDSISRYAEILGFSRLAVRVFSEFGGVAETETDAAGRLLIMALTVEQLRTKLKLYGSKSLKPNFLLQLSQTLEELRSACVSSHTLRNKLPDLSGVLAVKMEELALLLDGYAAVCANLGQSSETRLSRLLMSLEENPVFSEGRHFHFYGFTDFNGLELEIIRQLLEDGAEVFLYLLCDKMYTTKQQFATAAHTARSLYRMGQQSGIGVKVTEDDPQTEEDPFSFLRRNLFRSGKAVELSKNAVHFLDGANVMAECRMVAGEVLRLVQQGARFRDITLACADYEAYEAHLKTVFHRAGIPAYFAGDTAIVKQPVVHMLLGALDAALTRDREAVVRYMKSGFTGLSFDACDMLENYMLMWDINGSRLEENWTMSTRGTIGEREELKEQRLRELNESRQILMRPLLRLRSALLKAESTAQMILGLNTFMEDIQLNEQLNRRAAELSEKGELQKAQESAQVYSIICRLMEQIYGVLGNTLRTAEDFCLLFRTAVSLYTIGTIPATLDCVSIGSLSSQRNCETDYLFILGANEGAFPSVGNGRSLLNDRERTELIELEIQISPTTLAGGRLERELAMMDSLLASPMKELYLSSIRGRQSYFLLRASALFPNALHIDNDDALICRSEKDHTARYAKPASYDFTALDRDSVEQLYGKTMHLSSTKLESFAACQFQYFLRYGLRADEMKPAKVDSSIYGTFVHDVLENTARQVKTEGGFHRVSLKRVLEIADHIMEQYTHKELSDLWYSERAEYLFRRNFADVRMVVRQLYEELSVSAFEPEEFELQFGGRDGLPPIIVKGDHYYAQLEGKVDRVDAWQDGDLCYFRVVDYKTGHTTMDYSLLYNGLGMQMLIYLFALKKYAAKGKDTDPIAAGVMYFPARVDRISISQRDDIKAIQDGRSKAEKRSGILLKDEKVLYAMDPSDHYRFLPCKVSKGELRGTLADEEQFALLEKHIHHKIHDFTAGIAQGQIEPNPYYIDSSRQSCTWCPYGSVCANRGSRRVLPKLKDEDFWNLLEEDDANGQN